MKTLTKLLKCAPFAGFAYAGTPYYTRASQSIPSNDAPKLSSYFRQYVRENNLVTPSLYTKFQKAYTLNHFFEKGVLKELDGLDNYGLFLNKDCHDAMNQGDEASGENIKLHCTFSANSKLQGHFGAIHSGFTSTLFDNVAGCLAFMACDLSPAVTAYLNVSHERPLNVGEEYIAVVEVEKMEGRKVFVKGKIIDKENNVHTNMESLFIRPKQGSFVLKQLYRYLLVDKKPEEKRESFIPRGLWRQNVAQPWFAISN
jgi:acyl-coenzyme A thioesterase PaaI-like protein